VIQTAFARFSDLLRLLKLMFRSRAQLAAENLFLRKQLACYIERKVQPRRVDHASRIALVVLSPFVEWRELLTIVRPDTLIRWHRDLDRLFWRVQSRGGGRPHSALGPGLPAEPTRRARITGHRIATGYRVTVRARLGGLHHDYHLEPLAA
jgi:hypothetical protein